MPALEVFEGRFAYQELVRQHSQSPMVDFLAVVLAFDHLRRKIIQSPA